MTDQEIKDLFYSQEAQERICEFFRTATFEEIMAVLEKAKKIDQNGIKFRDAGPSQSPRARLR